jgi:hypothetical protein
MYVYANQLWIESENKGYANVLDVVANWLSYKLRQRLSGSDLIGDQEWKSSGHHVQTWSAQNRDGQYPWMTAVELTHGDDEVSGRQWSTQIGVKQQDPEEEVMFTILLETSDISPEVGSKPVETTRPNVVEDLLHAGDCQLAHRNVGQNIIPIGYDDADRLEELIDSERRWGIVLVSPDPVSGEPPVHLKYLRGQLLGLAQIINIPDATDAFQIYKKLGSIRSAFNGAINILHPRIKVESAYIPHDLIKYDDIKSIRDEDDERAVEGHILQKVVHRQNLRHYWQHVSPADVQRHRLHQRLHGLREDIDETSDEEEVRELIQAYEESREELESQVDDLKEQNDTYELRIIGLQDRLQEKESKINALQYQLSQKKESEQTEEQPPEEPPTRQFRSPEDVADAVKEEMDDRIFLRNRAKKEMRKSPYQSPADVYRAFWLLAEHFYPCFVGDEDLSDAVGKAKEMHIDYSHSMSDSTMGMFSDYSSTYKGRDADMNKHLKLGNSRDPQYSFRIHFEWDEEDEVVAIHHAGRHPENTQS